MREILSGSEPVGSRLSGSSSSAGHSSGAPAPSRRGGTGEDRAQGIGICVSSLDDWGAILQQ